MSKKLNMHGMSYTPEYKVWQEAKSRCSNKKHARFHQYGGRGIAMCNEWKGNFLAFWNDMGKRPTEQHTIDRIDNDKGYSPDNCRWATYTEQNNNRTGFNQRIDYNGESWTTAELSRFSGVAHCTIRDRLAAGRSVEEAVTVGRLPPMRAKYLPQGIHMTDPEGNR
jgi:hypothetical protein